ncbi:MAG: adenylyltransferase/cytidyltransferase family protein [Arachnia sp.]
MSTAFFLSAFDLVDVGDVDVLNQAAEGSDRVEAHVLSDEAVRQVTGLPPVMPAQERLEIVGAMRDVAHAKIFDPRHGIQRGPGDIVLARKDMGVGGVAVDRWVAPRRMRLDDNIGTVRPGGTANGVLGYVPGAWDRFHIGHLNILKRARALCERLVVGVVTDEELFKAKGKMPMVPLEERMQVVAAMDIVDAVVVDFSTSKLDVWDRVHFDVLFKGDDWKGTAKGDQLEAEMAGVGASVRYFPYTAHTSSTALRQILASR